MQQTLNILIFSAVLVLSHAFSMSTPSRPYAVNLKFSVKPARRQDFLSLIKQNQRKSLDLEPAALQYTVGEDIETPNCFYIHEQFIGVEGFDAHREMEHAADWAAFKNSDPFSEGGEPIIDFYYCDHEIEKVPVRAAFGLHVQLCIKPEMMSEFLKVIKNNQRGCVEDEPLCLQYIYGESTAEENKFVFHEEYEGGDAGKEGFEAHTVAPHFGVWEEFAGKDPFTKPPIVEFFRTLE